MDESKFEEWFSGFQEDFTLRQKERIAKMAWFRCRELYKNQHVMKIKLRKEDAFDAV